MRTKRASASAARCGGRTVAPRSCADCRGADMASHSAPAASGPPFPLEGLPNSPWREQALTRIGEQRFVLNWLTQLPGAVAPPADAQHTINDHWEAAAT